MKTLRRVAFVVLGLIAGLLVVEGVFHLRDHGAFPHLNVYRADEQLGVRLLPGSTEKISFSGNPVSQVRINAQGYRGADWAAHPDNELFVVGDSQAFGLGVEEDQAFAWRLGKALARPVANGAVPTYGPKEYNAVLAEELPRRKPKTVIYTINIANDLFEAAHPNTTRHAVWDGWAVRKETAPASVAAFPGRELLFRSSHAFFAARGLWFRTHSSTEEGAVASEGSWEDLLSAGKGLAEEQAAAKRAADDERKKRDEAISATLTEAHKLDAALGEALGKTLPEEELGASTLRTARASPGDIVRVYYGEGSQPIPALAAQIQQAAAARKRFEEKLKTNHDQETLSALTRRDQLDDTMKTLRAEPVAKLVRERSPLHPHLAAAKALCDANGAELVVLVLPLDVQVSAEEWKKYGRTEALDLTATRVLGEDVLSMADELGARTVDAWPALAAAEPGAFLNGDLHMTPKGHDAVAVAIARALALPRTPRSAIPPLPLGRSAVPKPEEWKDSTPPVQHYGMDAADQRRFGCKAQQLREWIRLDCKAATMVVEIARRAEPLVVNTPDGASVVAAALEGDRYQVRIYGKRTGVFRVDWALGEPEYTALLQDGATKRASPSVTPAELALCACHKEVTGAADCSALYGSADEACAKTYSSDCRALLACDRGDASAAPACADGRKLAGVTHRCLSAREAERLDVFGGTHRASLPDLFDLK